MMHGPVETQMKGIQMTRNSRTRAILVLAAALMMPACRHHDDDPVPPPQPGETEPNDTPGTANYLGPQGGAYSRTGRINPMGDDDHFSVDVFTGSILTIDLANLPADYGLDLYDDLGALAASSNNTSTNPEQIVHVAATPGRYTILVYGVAGAFDAGLDYLLTVDVTLPGALEPRFGIGGIVPVNPDSGSFEMFNGGAVDAAGGFMYLVGGVGDGSATNPKWWIEKRLLSDGSLVWAAPSGSDPTAAVIGEATAVAIDVANGRMYVVGTEASGGGDMNWRFEKRLLSTGAHDATTFGGGTGIWGSAASFQDDAPTAVAIDGTWMYVVGYDEQMGAGNRQWRIEKRSLTTALEDLSFGTSGVILSSPSRDDGGPEDMAIDVANNVMYVVGTSLTAGGNLQWQIEKRSLSSGLGDFGFDTDGVYPIDHSAGDDELRSIAIDTTGGFMILVGDDSFLGGSNRRWRIEKRQLSSGNLIIGFGTGTGEAFVNQDPGFDFGLQAFLDGSSLYVSGLIHVNPPFPGENFRIEIQKWDVATGLPVATWGSAGVVIEDPTAFADGLAVLGADSTYLYLAGIDGLALVTGSSDSGWRIEKRTK